MARPRLLLVPTFTEVMWLVRPLLEEWAEVAAYDAPGVGSEPAVDEPIFDAVARRGLEELDRRQWERCVIVGDEFGAAAAIRNPRGPEDPGPAPGRPRRSGVRGRAAGRPLDRARPAGAG